MLIKKIKQTPYGEEIIQEYSSEVNEFLFYYYCRESILNYIHSIYNEYQSEAKMIEQKNLEELKAKGKLIDINEYRKKRGKQD